MVLHTGAPAPLFEAPSPVNPRFNFGSLGGRYVLLAFLPAPGPARDAAVDLIRRHAEAFHDGARVFFGVLPDEASFRAARDTRPHRWFGDWTGAVRRLYGAVDDTGEVDPCWVLVDPSMRVLERAPLSEGRAVLARLLARGQPEEHAGVPLWAPVLLVPRILEPNLCRTLIDLYKADGGSPSGTMQTRDGMTVGVLDNFKKRRDATIENDALCNALARRIQLRLLPEIQKAFQFRATRLERYIVACYDAGDGGYFRPHRDNTTPATRHRVFAVSINLNAEEFEGGDLRFPEFGPKTYRPPTGGAVVFSCSLLHEATPVTRGTRYAFLPFLYDEAGAEMRAASAHTIVTAPTEPAEV